MVNATLKKNTVSVARHEYIRLKKLDERFSDFFTYLEHLLDIREARREVKKGKFVAQEKLFKRLGL